MGALAAVGAVVGLVTANKQRKAQKKQLRAQEEANAINEQGRLDAVEERKKAQSVQKARQFESNAISARKSARQNRIRRAKILQASESGGTGGSSGEFGAIGSVSTQAGAGRGAAGSSQNQAVLEAGFLQNASNFVEVSAKQSNDAQTFGAISQTGFSVFNAAGGFDTIFSK